MSTETTSPDTSTTEADHTEALEVIDLQVRFLSREAERVEASEAYRLLRRLAALRKSRAVLDGTAVPDFIAALGNRMANTERERSNHPVLRPGLEERQRLCAIAVTLNGNPARITGTVNDFATVTDTKSGLSAEWSWYTVARVVEAGGRFFS